MTKTDFERVVKIFDSLKAIGKNEAKLSSVIRFNISFSCLMAVRGVLAEWDKDEDASYTFLEMLTEQLGHAIYDMAKIILEEQTKI